MSGSIPSSVTILGDFLTLGNFKSLGQQLFSPNLSHSNAIFVKVSKSIIFLVISVLGKFYRHSAIFFWSHCSEAPIQLNSLFSV